MRLTIKTDGYDNAVVRVKGEKKYRDVYVGDSLEQFVRGVSRVEVSTKKFEGSSKVNLEPMRDGDGGGFKVMGRSVPEGVWACSRGLRRFGIKGSVTKALYIKVRK